MIEPALRRLDLLLRLDANRVRTGVPRATWTADGWCISDEHVDRLLSTVGEDRAVAPPPVEVDRAAADAALAAHPAWRRLIDAFHLSGFERDVVLLALAPELDPRYETILGYLNDDLSRTRATRATTLRVLDGGRAERAALDDGAPLLAEGVLRPLPAAGDGWPGTGLALGAAALRHLLELPPGDGELRRRPPRDPVTVDAPSRAWLERLAALARSAPDPPLVLIVTEDAAADVVDALAARLGVPALELAQPTAALARRAALTQRLSGCLVAVHGTGALAPLLEAPGVAVLALPDGQDPPAGVRAVRYPRVLGDRRARRTRWRAGLAAAGVRVGPSTLDRLAHRFELDAPQIDRAVRRAADTHALEGSGGPASGAVLAAARGETADRLRALTVTLPTDCRWADLVLPDVTRRRLRDVAGALAGADVVFRDWDFATRTADRRAVNVLFAGASGTGKTLAARVIAGELGIELFAVDLSAVVSKYIGETEKNLDRIFTAAEGSGALLLFDEADALFGKRSEVKDAHDRYANIEVAYLLARLEQHDGTVILATNLGANLDAAFSRRMHYVVEFPLPAAGLREHLWRTTFPAAAPLARDVDLPWLARQFALSGGEIRTVALDAAFSAAGDGRVITMAHLVHAVARQLEKRGRNATALEFQHYHALLGTPP